MGDIKHLNHWILSSISGELTNFVNVELPNQIGFGGLTPSTSPSTSDSTSPSARTSARTPSSVSSGTATASSSKSQQDRQEILGLARALAAQISGSIPSANPAGEAEARLFHIQEQREKLTFLRELKSDLARVDRDVDLEFFEMISAKIQQLQRELFQ